MLLLNQDHRSRRHSGRGRARSGQDHERGQSLVEFSLVIPLFMILLTGMIEFCFILNSVLSISYATREASLIAAEAGNGDGADCVILSKVEESITAPSTDGNVTEVRIFKADRNGIALATNRYVRSGSMTCVMPNGDVTVPYTLSGSENYQDTKRCNILAGCPANPPLPATTAVDHVGVEVRYSYFWHTPLRAFLDMQGTGYALIKSNSMRMEPVL